MLGLIFLFVAAESRLESYSANLTNNCIRSSSAYFNDLSISPYPFEDGNTKFSGTVMFLVENSYSAQLVVEYDGVPQDEPITIFTDKDFAPGQNFSFDVTQKMKDVKKTISGMSIDFEILVSNSSVVASCNIPIKVKDFASILIGSFMISLLI